MFAPRVTAALVALAAASSAAAGQFQYQCTTASVSALQNNGKLGRSESADTFLGRRFMVDRNTGTVLGGGVGNSHFPTKQVVDSGSEQTSFKVVWISRELKPGSKTYNSVYLEVDEAQSSTDKPFVLVNNPDVLTGTCQ